MIRNKTNRLLPILAIVLICAFAGLFFLNSVFKVQSVSGQKQVTVAVIHSDGTSTSHTYQTEAEYLGEILTAEGLAKGDILLKVKRQMSRNSSSAVFQKMAGM